MDARRKQEFIRLKARQNQTDPAGEKIRWSRHGIIELINEGWSRVSVEIALRSGEVIEDYPSLTRPLPDCLVLSRLPSGKPCHAVIALDEENDRLFVVTVYQPTDKEWENDWRTRKK